MNNIERPAHNDAAIPTILLLVVVLALRPSHHGLLAIAHALGFSVSRVSRVVSMGDDRAKGVA